MTNIQSLLDALGNLGGMMNPEVGEQQQQRQRTAEMIRDRLFNEQQGSQRMAMEQQRLEAETKNWDDENQARQTKAQQDAFQEQMAISKGIAGGEFRSPASGGAVASIPSQESIMPPTGSGEAGISDIGRTMATPGFNFPAEENPTAIKTPLTGQTIIPISPEERIANETAQKTAARQAWAANDPEKQQWLKDNADRLNELDVTGKFFPSLNPKNQAMQDLSDAIDSGDKDAEKAARTKLAEMSPSGASSPGKVLDPNNRDPQNMFNSGYDEKTLRTQAVRYNITGGDLASLGIGGVVPKQAVQRYAEEIEPGADLAANKLAYNANKGAIEQQMKTFANITSYENTGKGNIIRALDIAKDIPDTLSPWLNKPVREFYRAAAGNPNLSAFRTALLTAQNEYGRITTGGPTMGGVVSDTARAEVAKAIPDDATLAQLLESGKVAVADMEQRKHDSANMVDFLMRNAGGGAKGLADLATRTPDYSKINYKNPSKTTPETGVIPTRTTGTPKTLSPFEQYKRDHPNLYPNQ